MDIKNSSKLSTLLESVVRDATSLVRGHVELAKAEIRESIKSALTSSIFFLLAIALINLGIILIFVAAAYGLNAAGLPVWQSFLITALALLIVGGLLAYFGVKKMRRAANPNKTKDSLKKTLDAVTGLMDSVDF